MTKRIAFALILIGASLSFGQTSPKESDILPALLDEMRQLRKAIEGMTAASQRVQIALYGLQMQDSAVSRARQRLDSLSNKCAAPEANRQHTEEVIRRLESGLTYGTLPEVEAKEAKARLSDLKSELEVQKAEVQTCQATESGALADLRNEQTKLLELQDRMARLDKALEQLGRGK